MTKSPVSKKMPSSFRLWRYYLFFVLTMLVCVSNAGHIKKYLAVKELERQRLPYIFLGMKFLGLDETLKDMEWVGYYTDKNLDDRIAAMQFAQAQLVLAPRILDLNNTSHEFTIFDCSSPEAAWQKIRELGAQPLKQNQFGVILARTSPPRATGE